ncbi:MAG: MFS transporter [Gemmobacter sp.]
MDDTGRAGRIGRRWPAFAHPGFARFWAMVLCVNLSAQVQTVAVGWHVYDMTRDPLDLGLVGLSQFLPALVLVLLTGAVADRFARRRVIAICLALELCCALALLALTRAQAGDVRLIFAAMVVFGVARAFYNPARQSLLPNLVPPADLSNAVALTTTTFQVTTIAGPMLGGLIYGLRPELAFATSACLIGAAIVLALLIPPPRQLRAEGGPRLEVMLAGFRFIWGRKVILGAISLDLFAVLLGGAVALLPVFARDVLAVGPVGLGVLRAAPGIGGIAMGLYLVSFPIRDHAGRLMLISAAGFGLCTAGFALSQVVWLSALCLLLAGAFDMVSVVLRGTLVQLWTPDALRGRVNAVNQVFVGASNELGAFRAGGMAALIGAVPAVLIGGAGCVAVAALWARIFPELRAIRRIDAPAPPEGAAPR